MESFESNSVLPTILKWIGIITAVISLTLGVRQVITIVSERAARTRKAAELINQAQHLARSGFYSKAWESASAAAELDGSLREVQVDVAMEWLRNARIAPAQKEQSFTAIVNEVLPVLHAALDTTQKERAATIAAHIGYVAFLLAKEGNAGANPERHFREALNGDCANMFANVMYGFWLLYPGQGTGSLDDAERHFQAALRSGKERSYVRALMLAAFHNQPTAAAAARLVRLANDMRKNRESLDHANRMKILSKAYFLHRGVIMTEVSKLLPPGEHLQAFLYLSEGIGTSTNAYYKAALDSLQQMQR